MSAYHENLDGLRIRIKLLYVKPVFIAWLHGLMSVLWYLLSTCGVRAKSVRALVSGHERTHGSACVCMDLLQSVSEQSMSACTCEVFCPLPHNIMMVECLLK